MTSSTIKKLFDKVEGTNKSPKAYHSQKSINKIYFYDINLHVKFDSSSGVGYLSSNSVADVSKIFISYTKTLNFFW